MKITVTNDAGEAKSAELYSKEGIELVTVLWTKTSFFHKVMYEPTWLGIPIIQFPNDMVMLQELIWKLRPDFIVETGVAHGGSAILYASILELIGKGTVIGIDIEIRKHNKLAINSHPLSSRIELIEGSSIDSSVVQRATQRIGTSKNILVTLDSNHSFDHVLAEMELYSPLVPPSGYLVVMDGIQELLSDTPIAKPGWADDNPARAIREFIKKHPNWIVDENYTRTHITCNPSGFLKRTE